MKKKHPLRKFFNDVHLWLGIASGLVLFIVCLTGTIYSFKTEIEHLANPSSYYVKADAGSLRLPVDTIITRLEKQYRGKLTSIQVPADPRMTYPVSIKTENVETDSNGAVKNNIQLSSQTTQETNRSGEKKVVDKAANDRPLSYFVNPYTATVVAEQGGGLSGFFSDVLKLHRWLLLDKPTGGLIVGSATVIFVLLILSGLVIWFPLRLKNWQKGLKVKFSANWKRINHDLHNAFGFYAFLLLLVMALTGLCWSFEWYRDGMGKLLGAKVFRGRGEKPMLSGVPAGTTATVSWGDLIAQANALFPYRGDVRISKPAEASGAVSISKTKTGFFAFAGADKVQLDRFTGKVLKTERFADKRFNEKIADLVKPLHTGEIYGKFTKFLYFLACLMATSLPVTGTLVWINKLKKKRKRQAVTAETGNVFLTKEKFSKTEISRPNF